MSRMNHRDARPSPGSISATRLSELAICQRMVQLNQGGNGPAPDAQRQQRLALGVAMHEDTVIAAGEAAPSSQRKGACFIATAIYGPTHRKTMQLRQWRDRVLRPHRFGRISIGLYYRFSPSVARWLTRNPARIRFARVLLDHAVAFLKGNA